jgi:hypothetical protein
MSVRQVAGINRESSPRQNELKITDAGGKRLKIDCQGNDLSGKYNAAPKRISPSCDKNGENT